LSHLGLHLLSLLGALLEFFLSLLLVLIHLSHHSLEFKIRINILKLGDKGLVLARVKVIIETILGNVELFGQLVIPSNRIVS
jgi:hypothetical protein